MKLFVFSSLVCHTMSFMFTTSNKYHHNSITNPTLIRNRFPQCATNRKDKVKLFYQNERDVIYYASNLEIIEKKSRMRSSSKIEYILMNGHSLVLELRNRAIKLENDTISEKEKKFYIKKLKDALLHLKTALHISRDADLKMGLCNRQQSIKAWNDIDIIYNNMELRSRDGKENKINDIIVVCDELEIMFNKFQ